jgi:hypothetical protein
MKLRTIWPVALLLVFVLVSCAPPPSLRDPNLLNDQSLLTDDPCAAPCWNNITPGETRWTEALEMVQGDTRFANVETVRGEGDSNAVGARWRAGADLPLCCQMVSGEGQTVDFISLQLTPEITIAEVIAVKGEPTYALGGEFASDQAYVMLFYPEQQMVLYVYVAGASSNLNENSEVVSVSYLRADDMQRVLTSTGLFLWRGYQPYSAYGGPNVDITPSATEEPQGS